MIPRVRCQSKSPNHFFGFYKGHTLDIRRENRNDPWYISVSGEDGYLYDGWWTEPEQEYRIATRREAIVEALKGSRLWGTD